MCYLYTAVSRDVDAIYAADITREPPVSLNDVLKKHESPGSGTRKPLVASHLFGSDDSGDQHFMSPTKPATKHRRTSSLPSSPSPMKPVVAKTNAHEYVASKNSIDTTTSGAPVTLETQIVTLRNAKFELMKKHSQDVANLESYYKSEIESLENSLSEARSKVKQVSDTLMTVSLEQMQTELTATRQMDELLKIENANLQQQVASNARNAARAREKNLSPGSPFHGGSRDRDDDNIKPSSVTTTSQPQPQPPLVPVATDGITNDYKVCDE